MTQQPIFSRLMGLETEYAVRFRSDAPNEHRSQISLYRSLLSELRDRLPTAIGSTLEEKHFTANGGTIGFERVSHIGGFGLVECATPECCGPRELITWQRAQDRLMMQCAKDCDEDGTLVLIKNSRDSIGNVYGTHENYSIRARGLGIWVWRAVALLASIAAFAFWFLFAPLLVLFIPCYWFCGFLVYLLWSQGKTRETKDDIYRKIFGDGFIDEPDATPCPRWLESCLNSVSFALLAPGTVAISLVAGYCIYGKTARLLTPFLVTRSVFTGSGWLGSDGTFRLAQKAPAIRTIYGPFANGMHPLFSAAHLMDACLIGWFNPMDFISVFRRDHRIQVCLGDSNMADEAEYLRVGTTGLLIDAIEAGSIVKCPKVRGPLNVMHRVAEDTSLSEVVGTWKGQPMTAIEIQKWYLSACRRFVEQQDDASDEAYEVLQRWGDTLDALQESPETLVGQIDWVTKQMLIREAGDDLSLESKRKIDIKYHELSDEGYFMLLAESDHVESLITDKSIEYAMRSPPENPRALRRAQFIREFADGSELISASWNSVRIGKLFNRRKIKL